MAEFESVKERLDAVERRIASCEGVGDQRQAAPRAGDESPVAGDQGEPPEEGKEFFAELRERMGNVQTGAISIIGGVYRFAPGRNLYWQSRVSNYPLKLPLIECCDDDATRFASIFSSIQRIRLLEAMVGAVQSSRDLRTKAGLGSGALYHHLRELMHAGFVEQRGRGRYTLTGAGMMGIITFLHVASERSRKAAQERTEGR